MAISDFNPIAIAGSGDWQTLAKRNLTTVLDPMVYRAGELFMRGRSGCAFGTPRTEVKDHEAWDFLDKNILSLGFFFDALVFNEQLPVFNYGDSFDMQLNFSARSFSVFEHEGVPALQPVDVQYGAYHPIKERMLAKLAKKLAPSAAGGEPWLSKDEAKAIVNEVSWSEYQWQISLGSEFEQSIPDPTDQFIARFMLGGMIFGEYAELLGSEHWLQPKRAGLFVKADFGEAAPARNDESELFRWLAHEHHLPILETTQPTFLYHILERADKLSDVPAVINKLRASGAVKDLRSWRSELLREYRSSGHVSEKSLTAARRIRDAIPQRGNGMNKVLDAGIAIVGAVETPSAASVASAGREAVLLFQPLLNYLPGRRHVKLLADSAHAKGRFIDITKKILSLWNSDS